MITINPKIGCIIILYNPDLSLLEQVLRSVESQVDLVYIIDNSDIATHLTLNESSRYHWMKFNSGIAAAQNYGISHLLEQGFTHLFFLDQDSILSPGLVQQLMNDLGDLQSAGINVGAIGARPYNRESQKKYTGSASKGTKYSEQLTEVGETMNSASLVPIENFNTIGLFDEMLFIDGVDHEWCWRSKNFGNFRFFISENTTISHYLGEGDRFLIYRSIAIPTTFRAYYQFRNYLILSKRSYVPIFWKIKNGLKLFVKFFYLSLFVKPRLDFLKRSFLGIVHGLKNNRI